MTPIGRPPGDAPGAPDKVPLPPQLVRHLRDGRLVLFAGAGLSATAGLPTWGPLLKRLVDTTVAESMASPQAAADLQRLHEAGKWLQVADHCREQLGERYVSLLGQELRGETVPIPEAHRLAMRLPFAAWVTTNYDKLLERAYTAERGGMAKTLTHLDADTLGTLLFDDVPYILKAHGDIDRPRSIVFTSRDYRELIHDNTAFSMAFSAVLLTRAVLFVGYSISDPDFNLLLDRQLVTFRGFVPERYALMPEVGEVERSYLWRVARIRVIEYPKDRHEAVTEFFRQLSREVGTGTSTPELPVTPPSPAPAPPPPPGGRGLAPPDTAAAAAPKPPIVRLRIRMTGAGFEVSFEEDLERILPREPSTVNWPALLEACRRAGKHRLLDGTEGIATLSTALAQVIGGPALKALRAHLETPGNVQVVLDLDAGAGHFPWEYLPLDGTPLCTRAPVSREPVGISAAARGRPALDPPLRALVIGNPSSGELSLPGAEAEARELAGIARDAVGARTRLLLGSEATLDRLRETLATERPHIVHFAGHAWFEEDEPYLQMADGRLPVGMLRPWIARNPPALMVLNSHFTSFVPPGVEEAPSAAAEKALQAGVVGMPGFADLAMRAGVGAFVGTFAGAISDDGAQRFALELYRRLFAGQSIIQAVWIARREALTERDATSLAYSLHGDGQLRIP
jgi:hypothetical protein